MLTEMDPESAAAIARLDRYRLEHDLSYEDLAAEMTAAGFKIKTRTLHFVMRARTAMPRDRTTFKIREFVARRTTADRKPAPERKRRRA